MSRWSSRRQVVRIGAGSVRCTGADGSPGPELHCAGEADTALESALCGVLSSMHPARRALEFELATELCRFQVVPWVDGLHSREHRHTLARSRFEAVFGGAARDWSVQLCEGGFGRGGLAVAVPAWLPAAIVGASRAVGATAARIRPACSTGIDQLLRKAGARASWLVVPDGDRVFVGSVQRGGWTGVSTLHDTGHGFFRPLGDLLIRESLLAAVAVARAPVLIYVPPKQGAARTAHPPLRVLDAGGERWALEWVGL